MSEADSPGEATSGGTHAATPRALGIDGRGAADPHEAPTHMLAPAAGSTSTAAPTSYAFPATADAIDHAELPRTRLFATLGAGMSSLALLATLVLGGDPIARWVLRAGLGLIVVTNLWLLWLTGRTGRYRVGPLVVVWVGASFGVMSAVYFFGPYSAAVAAPMLGITFVALGKSARLARAVTALCIGAHLAMAIPLALHVVADRSLLPSAMVPRNQLLVAEGLLCCLLLASYAMGRWLRRTTSIAMAEVERARRRIGDQEVALAEAHADVERVRRVGEGRWTGHSMGSFQLGLVLGRGAMGEVYEARGATGGEAAVKVLTAKATESPQLTMRFHRELSVCAGLDSPHIVKTFEIAGPTSPHLYLAMERLYGRDLATILRAAEPHGGKLDPDELLTMLDHVARGLEAAAAAGVVHRDLKPHNVFRAEYSDRPPVWKILDFGVSKLLGGEGTLTGEGIVGTPQYMAPEQATHQEVTPAADVYAMAAIVYRCVTGRPPFSDGDLSRLLLKVIGAAPQRPGSLAPISRELEDVLAIGLAKNPARRFPSATAFARAVGAARMGHAPTLAVPRGAWATGA